jgi:hypothetical protein
MSDNPYEPPKAPVRDQVKAKVSVGWKRSLAVWWSVSWRGALYGLLGGLILGMIGGILAALSGVPEQAQQFGTVGGYIAAIPASMLGTKQGLSAHLASLVREHAQAVA